MLVEHPNITHSNMTHFNIKHLTNLSSSLEILPSANYVNNQADKLSDKLDKIRLEYSKKTHNKEYLIDRFVIDKNISTYYFTELVERNVYKYQYYKLLAQFDSIKHFLDEEDDIELIIYSIKEENNRMSLIELLPQKKYNQTIFNECIHMYICFTCTRVLFLKNTYQ